MKLTPEQKEEWIEAALAFVEGEPIEYQTPDGKWWDTDNIDVRYPHRRKPKPETLAEVKAAHAAGKPVEYSAKGYWYLYDPETGMEIDTNGGHRAWRIAESRMVPLEAEDLIGCVLRPPVATAGWIAIEGTSEGLVYIPPRGCYERSIPFAKLQADGWTYHRPGDRDADGKPVWRRCEKEAKL